MQSSQFMSRQVWIPFSPHIDSSPLSSPSLHSVSRLLFVSMGTSFNVRFICISEAHKERALRTIHLPQGLRQVPESRQDQATTDQGLSAINWQRKLYILQCLSKDDFFLQVHNSIKLPFGMNFNVSLYKKYHYDALFTLPSARIGLSPSSAHMCEPQYWLPASSC